ncbi:tyrosine-type recombinase/integrase [Fulvivirga sp. 29W222]|uniref:Tyrosine-type recombinase/integrase n=1 Tax=Fulvivirga marina TaxID=2494733 RepID=A0A937KDZ7_9BACT|nr:tyrosine-type recombinase/integrase [Fulvivirga marina]
MYCLHYRPKKYLFERPTGATSSEISIQKIVKRVAKNVNIRKRVNRHTLRYSFVTHLLENGTNLCYIQTLLGHNSSRTTEIYTHVGIKNIKSLKSPFDLLDLGNV